MWTCIFLMSVPFLGGSICRDVTPNDRGNLLLACRGQMDLYVSHSMWRRHWPRMVCICVEFELLIVPSCRVNKCWETVFNTFDPTERFETCTLCDVNIRVHTARPFIFIPLLYNFRKRFFCTHFRHNQDERVIRDSVYPERFGLVLVSYCSVWTFLRSLNVFIKRISRL